MGKIKSKKSEENAWQTVELSTEEYSFIEHFDAAMQAQLIMNQELLRDYLNTIASRNGLDPNDTLEFNVEPGETTIRIRKITAA